MGVRFEAEPNVLLKPYVRAYWARFCDDDVGPFTVTPDCYVELLIFTRQPALRMCGIERWMPQCFVVPLLDAPFELVMGRAPRCAAVRLYGTSATLLGGEAAQAGIDGTPCCQPPIEFQEAARAVIDALERKAWPEIISVFDTALMTLLSAKRIDPASWELARPFFAAPPEPSLSATDVGKRAGQSRRKIERRVRALTNRSPKQVMQLARFQFVRDMLWAQPDRVLSDLASEAGYADQAHLSREFRRFSGMTPSAFRRLHFELRVAGQERVAFVQDLGHERQ